MKLTVCLLVLLGAIALVSGETCSPTQHCHHVTCPENNYVVECENHQCTCTHVTKSCSSANDCQVPDCHRTEHCIDGRCRCGLFNTGGK